MFFVENKIACCMLFSSGVQTGEEGLENRDFKALGPDHTMCFVGSTATCFDLEPTVLYGSENRSGLAPVMRFILY